jgi:hypothetical protein
VRARTVQEASRDYEARPDSADYLCRRYAHKKSSFDLLTWKMSLSPHSVMAVSETMSGSLAERPDWLVQCVEVALVAEMEYRVKNSPPLWVVWFVTKNNEPVEFLHIGAVT